MAFVRTDDEAGLLHTIQRHFETKSLFVNKNFRRRWGEVDVVEIKCVGGVQRSILAKSMVRSLQLFVRKVGRFVGSGRGLARVFGLGKLKPQP